MASFFRNIKIRYKILAISFISIIVLALSMLYIVTYTTSYIKQKLDTTLEHEAEEKMKIAVQSMAVAISESVKDLPTRQEKLALLQKMVDNTFYDYDNESGDKGSFFAYDGTILVGYPTRFGAKLGEDWKDVTDPNGVKLILDLQAAANKGGGITRYMWHLTDMNSPLAPKVSYAYPIASMPGVWIGSGIYTQDIKANINRFSGAIRSNILYTAIAAIIIFIIITFPMTIIISKYISKGLSNIRLIFEEFVLFLKQDERASTVNLNKLKLGKDEISAIINNVNQSIAIAQESLSKDKVCVEEIVEALKSCREGDFKAALTHTPSNPQLTLVRQFLEDFLKELLDNMTSISTTINRFAKNDFTSSIDITKLKGEFLSVSNSVNILRDITTKDTKASLDVAQKLNEEAKKLNTQITNLSTSSNAQASSLEQSATAIEEITQSMQN
ncbi:methyl-accepting chemotaxis protein, partial [Helicobacter sp. 11S02629-2]|uniref:cache domain-containing protein n=1 Tax=Helicobacter sp. 11S02629-2 TaxID=1476195 RepID=UPI000BD51AE3